ncbi:MAG: hypothetical protein ACOX1I_04760 [Dethiobacteria bacterium]
MYNIFDSSSGEYSVTLELDIKLRRSALPTAARMVWNDNPNALSLTFAEEDIRIWYPWDYKQLVEKLTERYRNFKQDQKFNNIRMLLKNNKKYVMSRYLDPDNPSSSKKDFYSHSKNPAEFDSCRVLRYFLLVGATGLEPATS